ncbi:SDR family NAD(P)-dependent oxidoreductase [Mycolicibacterium sp. J2]|uniref:SDR family NAD(P)-dependent oxidoreductase n=1 Tax=Mycolicibacterium sp. J2 TaxID=2993511 RepID=UPI00224A6D37|nr:SDR family NAD(P)-dependent oxidoreductase [Mycolicibacterium sp. J2]MCX2715358.1 SDR family NAD(P)-dependent oxidoreductase [Mycolicibacterium sp. J2]
MTRHRIDLNGATVVITGAAGGIGSAVATTLHRRGARVVLVDLSQDAVDSVAAGLSAPRTLAMSADVTDKDTMAAVVAAARDRFGGIDVVIANAGISSGNVAFTASTAPDGIFERVLAVNLFGVWNTVRAALPSIREARGHVLVTSSTYAYVNGAVNIPYAASKAAVEQIGRSLRVELAPHGASAGVLYPGWVATPIADVAFGADDLATQLVARGFPGPLHTPVQAEVIARAVARGIERRAPSIQAPRRWAPVSALRGLLNPVIDGRLARDPEMHRLIRELEQR